MPSVEPEQFTQVGSVGTPNHHLLWSWEHIRTQGHSMVLLDKMTRME